MMLKCHAFFEAESHAAAAAAGEEEEEEEEELPVKFVAMKIKKEREKVN